jgi:hypothetical protein
MVAVMAKLIPACNDPVSPLTTELRKELQGPVKHGLGMIRSRNKAGKTVFSETKGKKKMLTLTQVSVFSSAT